MVVSKQTFVEKEVSLIIDLGTPRKLLTINIFNYALNVYKRYT